MTLVKLVSSRLADDLMTEGEKATKPNAEAESSPGVRMSANGLERCLRFLCYLLFDPMHNPSVTALI
jgi:hypothetical protein